jgi:toxin ParE1/3/4
MKVVRTAAANQDLLRHYRYLGIRNRRAADKMAMQIDRLFRQLSEFPASGVPRHDLMPGLRARIAGFLVVFYQAEVGRVLILRVIDGRMDVDAEFHS